MKELIGVAGSSDYELLMSLKREALIFHRIAIRIWLSYFKETQRRNGGMGEFQDELEWLAEQGIVFEPKYSDKALSSHEQYNELKSLKTTLDKRYDEVSLRNKNIPLGIDAEELRELRSNSPSRKEEGKLYLQTADLEKRLMSIALRELEGIDAVPILSAEAYPETQASNAHILQIVLHAIPIPDATTSWEHIIEYRSDPDSYSKFLALRNWMIDISKKNLTPIEIEQKLEFLINQYQQHVKLHRMKVNRGTLQTLVISTAEFMEDLIKVRWGKLAKSMFAFKERKIALLEGELTSPGSEVAYIIKARESFN